ncbi:MAG TPA: hypothetical protein VN706_00580 [Gemmatimonadaceae bacterium]|nr:hypothetical protein [Gemmatimonadaceae bacterium]
MAEPSAARRSRRAVTALRSLLTYLDEIERALMQRDAMRVTALLRKRTATHLPRDVREELLFLSRAPRDSLRAPVRFLRFQHRMTMLAHGGEGLPTAQTELSLEARASAGTIRLRDVEDRRTAAHDGVEDDD